MKLKSLCVALLVLGLAPATRGDEIVQEGTLSGNKGGPTPHEIFLDQFDDADGTLNFVHVDLLTSTIGGGQTTGSGVPVHISVVLSADYFLDGETLAETEAVIDTTIPNTGPPSAFSLFDTDTAEVLIDQPADLAPWIGQGQIMLDAMTKFHIELDPEDEIDFSAGGTVRYTVTYNFDPASGEAVPLGAPWPLAALMTLVACVGIARRPESA